MALLVVSDAFWVAVPAMIGAIGGCCATIYGIATSRRTETIDGKQDKLKTTLDEVHVLTNSRALEADKKLSAALEEVSKLQVLVGQMNAKAQESVTAETIRITMQESIREALAAAKDEKKKPA